MTTTEGQKLAAQLQTGNKLTAIQLTAEHLGKTVTVTDYNKVTRTGRLWSIELRDASCRVILRFVETYAEAFVDRGAEVVVS